MKGYNSSIGAYETWNGSAWVQEITSANTGAAGHALPYLDGPNVWGAGQSLNNVIAAQTAHDEIIGTDGVIAASSTAFSSQSANFRNQDRGKTIIINGAGSSGADLITTISSVTDSTHVTLATIATYATPWWTVGRAYHASTSDVSASYAVGDAITVSGGTPVAGASGVFTIISLEVSTPTVAVGGSGGANGACTVIGTTGVTRTTWGPALSSATSANGYFTATGVVSGGVLTGPLTIVQAGDYSTAPTVQSAEPVVPYSGCAGLTGATVSLKMAPHMLQQTTPGHYTALPANPVATTTNGSGVGATLNLWGLTSTGYSASAGAGDRVGGYYAYGTDDTAAINAAIIAAQAAPGACVSLPAGRSLMLGAFNIPYVGTNPPVQPALCIMGAGQLSPQTYSGGFVSAYSGGVSGSIIDNRYAGGDGAGHVAKIDTRGQGVLSLHDFSLVDWGTDNFLMFQTTNTKPILRDMTFLGNPTCYRMTCAQDMIRLGGITSAASTLSTASATGGFQGYPATLDSVFAGHGREIVQLGGSANASYIANIQADSTNGAWTTGAIHHYGPGSYGTGFNYFSGGGYVEMSGYPYVHYYDTTGGGSNNADQIFGPGGFDGSLITVGKNGAPTLGYAFFDSNSIYNYVSTPVENDLQLNFVTQLGAASNTVCSYYNSPPCSFPGTVLTGKLGVGLAAGKVPTYPFDYGAGTGTATARINGGASGTAGGSSLLFSNGGQACGAIGGRSAVLGGAYNNELVMQALCGPMDFYSFNAPVLSLYFNLATLDVHLASAQTTPPTITGTGTPTISGTDTAGTVTMGANATTATITFNAAYVTAPHCTVTWRATPLASQSYTVSTTAITLTQTSTSGNLVDYICVAPSGG